MKRIIILISIISLVSCQVENQKSDSTANGSNSTDSVIHMENSNILLKMDLYGGSFFHLVHKSNPVNPLTWSVAVDQMPENNRGGAAFKGHFLCLGRWGSPSEGEKAAGVPHNGEPANSLWKAEVNTQKKAVITHYSELEKMRVSRTVTLADEAPAVLVSESFTNELPTGRLTNVVQHVTLGPPFLSEEMQVSSNATFGFNHKFATPDPHVYQSRWPAVLSKDKDTLDARLSTSESYVAGYIFDPDDTYGWITAYQPTEGLVLGYVWKISEYPWLALWHQMEEGKPVAKGLEFGTTAIGAPYETLLRDDIRFHGRTPWVYMDAGEKTEKHFQVFFLPVDQENFEGIRVDEHSIQIGKVNIPNLLN